MLVSRHEELLEHARAFRNYGKPDHAVEGLNFRISEFTAAIGLVQTERLDEIVAARTRFARERARPACIRAASRAPRRNDLGPLQVHRLRRRSSARPARSTTSPATGSWAPATTCPTATGSPRTTGACRSTTAPAWKPASRQGSAPRRRETVMSGPGHRRLGLHRLARRRQAAAEAGTSRASSTCAPRRTTSPAKSTTVVGDLLDAEALEDAMDGCDAVDPPRRRADVGDRRRAARGAPRSQRARHPDGARGGPGHRHRRVVYGSTIWVYGDSAGRSGVIDEDSPLGLPDHLYTASKLAGEMYCTSYAELYDVPCTILRFGIPYGPRARPAAVIPIFVREGARRRAADDRRRRPADAPLRLRRGPRGGRGRGARPRRRQPRLQPRRATTTVTIRELAEIGPGARRRRRDRPHPGPQRRLRRGRDLERAGPSASSAGAPPPRSARE